MNEVGETALKCLKNQALAKFPGMKVGSGDTCQGTVVNGFCRGKPANEKCDHHIDCDVGLRCGTSLVCENAGEEGSYCDDDYLLCQSYLNCKENLCTKYGSISDDHPVGKSGVDMCRSHYIDAHRVCRPGPNLLGDIYVESNEKKCLYSNGDEEQAACGFHKDGKAICKPGAGNLAGTWNDVSVFLITNSS